MKLNFRLIIILWALIVTALVCLIFGCQSKKKLLSIQKNATVEQSEVKKEVSEHVNDQSTFIITKDDKTKVSVIEEWFRPDSPLIYRKTTYQANNISSKENKKSDLIRSSQTNSDSSGVTKVITKEKLSNKDVSDNLTGKAVGIGFLVLCVLAAMVWIWFQRKSKIV